MSAATILKDAGRDFDEATTAELFAAWSIDDARDRLQIIRDELADNAGVPLSQQTGTYVLRRVWLKRQADELATHISLLDMSLHALQTGGEDVEGLDLLLEEADDMVEHFNPGGAA